MKIAAEHKMEAIEMREAYMRTMIEIAEKDKRVIDLEADLMGPVLMGEFKKRFPNRLVNCGIAEQTMYTMAAGLAVRGFVPFAQTFGVFAARRAADQIYLSCGYSKTNVKIVGTDPGITGALNGGTHQAMEDIAILRPLPNITMYEPCDSTQLKWALRDAAGNEGLYYIRLSRKPTVKVYADDAEFKMGKAVQVRSGSDVTIAACGAIMMEQALLAADRLEKEGVSARVLDLFSIKPLDTDAILRCAKETGAIVVAENHFTIGGVGSAVAEVLAEAGQGIPFKTLGVRDAYGEVGQVEYLMERFGMTFNDIAAAAKELIGKK